MIAKKTVILNSSTLHNCKTQIEAKLNWGPSSNWQNQEFEELSQVIFNKTAINLSHTTLKRVWGKVKYANQPSISTLDAMAKYLDYPNWSAFKRDQEIQHPSKKIHFNFLLSKRSVIAMTVIMLLSFSSWYIVTSNLKDPEALAANLQFEANYASFGLPNSVIFSFDASEIEAEQLVIQQSWDKSKRINVSADQTTATSMYYYPGYFRSKFVADEVVLKESDVFIKTDGWLATINTEPTPIYLKSKDLITNDKLTLSEEGIDRLKQSTAPVGYHFYTLEENIDGDNFDFETSIRYVEENQNSACKYAKVVLHFKEGVFLVPFVIPGCVSEVNCMVMENFVSGKTNDLSAFGIDLNDWRHISISSHHKMMKVSIDDTEIFTHAFQKDPGSLVGISFQFDGVGEIDHVLMTNGSDNWTFDHSFK